ncbi:helix-turn-helix domain-containing protein [Vagococcus sp. BWB3-3]|uniref:Helix-turn-helix domain-containing protein n=1 Tax=Vagococcus allomyrinae TaxID=2794353 RepID=A0A940PDL0_9ENTE|nr:AraC family transcriptional regulator [Vagococcus allomyrinae]MBP1042865.1 helix-turn-helix domain-containing protein [Vagococcus allomyrinae]
MNVETLREKLMTMTASELKYQAQASATDTTYDDLTKEYVNGQEVCVFKFDEQVKDKIHPYTFNPKLGIVKHSRFSVIPMHIHDYIEMNYVYAGSCSVTIQDTTLTLHQGDVCIMDTNVPHTIKDVNEEDIVINFLMKKSYFNTSILSQLSSNSIISDFLLEVISKSQEHDRYILFHSKSSQKLTLFVENLLCEYYDFSFCTKEVINAYMILIFAELLYHYQASQITAIEESALINVREILEHIEENYSDCTLASVAETFAFHPNYLSRYIRKHTGKSFKQLVQEQKLNKASFLLLNTQDSVETIIAEVGYRNHGFFNTLFRERYSLSPSEYRKTHLETVDPV